jgi:hypothetical protein
LTVQGELSQPRPSFDRHEIDHLLAFLPAWAEQGRLTIERDIRPLLRDYVEFLLFTGVRRGTEARRLEWRHLQWHWAGEKRYLRVWVSGKTGPRYLIARSGAIAALDRLARRNWGNSLDQMIEERAAGASAAPCRWQSHHSQPQLGALWLMAFCESLSRLPKGATRRVRPFGPKGQQRLL